MLLSEEVALDSLQFSVKLCTQPTLLSQKLQLIKNKLKMIRTFNNDKQNHLLATVTHIRAYLEKNGGMSRDEVCAEVLRIVTSGTSLLFTYKKRPKQMLGNQTCAAYIQIAPQGFRGGITDDAEFRMKSYDPKDSHVWYASDVSMIAYIGFGSQVGRRHIEVNLFNLVLN